MNERWLDGTTLVVRIDSSLQRKLEDERARLCATTRRNVKLSSCVRRLLRLALDAEPDPLVGLTVRPPAGMSSEQPDSSSQSAKAPRTSVAPELSPEIIARFTRETRRAELEIRFSEHARRTQLTPHAFSRLIRSIDSELNVQDIMDWYNRAALPKDNLAADRILESVNALINMRSST